MKILCAKCFSNIEDVNKKLAVCSNCGTTYILQEKASIFRVLLDGGFIKEGMTYDDVVKGVKEATVLPDEYVATYSGPWIAIIDSPFAKFISKSNEKKSKEARYEIFLYKERKSRYIAITLLSGFFILSLVTNVVFLWIISNMNKRIEDLILKATGG